MSQELYQWQEDCLERWNANGRKGIVQAVTGSGKTCLALEAIRQVQKELNGDLRIKIVVPTGELLWQWNRILKSYLAAERKNRGHTEEDIDSIGLRGSGYQKSSNRRYMIYVINSARYELAREILEELKNGDSVFLIADECHHYGSGQNRLIFEFLPYAGPYRERFFSLGLSATLPLGEERDYLVSVLGKVIYDYGMKQASCWHTVCPYDVYHIALSFQKEERDRYDEITERMQNLYRKLQNLYPELKYRNRKESFEFLRQKVGEMKGRGVETAVLYLKLAYKRKSLVCLASARCNCACELMRRLGIARKVIIFGERICQAEQLYWLLEQEFPGRVGRYHSKMGERANKNAIERFREGTLRVLIACKSADEGIDLPDAEIGIILSGTTAQRQKIQRLGRILRKQKSKECASLYYLHIADNVEENCFLPDENSRFSFELEYMEEEERFSHPLYDQMAQKVLDEISPGTAQIQEEKRKEAVHCLKHGCVRSDWLRECEDLEERIKSSRYTRERNYWVCMKRIAWHWKNGVAVYQCEKGKIPCL